MIQDERNECVGLDVQSQYILVWDWDRGFELDFGVGLRCEFENRNPQR